MHRVAIVGGETHIGEVTGLEGRELTIVGVTVRADQTDWAHRTFGAAPIFTDHEAMLDEVPCDVVAVANENDVHAEAVLQALSRGKHVIVDKPMALRLSDVDAIEAESKRRGCSVLMLLTLRGNPWYRKLREIVLSGEIGAPVQVGGRMSVELKPGERPAWFLDKERAGGPILDLAIHTIDQVEWITGLKLTEVTAYEANLSHPADRRLIDSGAMFFRMNNGGTAYIEQSRVMPPGSGSDYRLDVMGTKGQADLRFGKSLSVLVEAGEKTIGPEDLDTPVSVVADWLRSLDERTEPLVPDAASLRASRIACLAKQAADEGRMVTIGADGRWPD